MSERDPKQALAHEKALLLKYACERIARSVWKTGWRQRARYMQRAALFAAVCDTSELKHPALGEVGAS